MSSHQARVYRETDFSSQIEMVAQILVDHPGGISAEEGAARCDPPPDENTFPENRFTARMGDLMRKGRAYTTEGAGKKLYHYEPLKAKWPARIKAYKASRHPVTKLAEWLKGKNSLTPERRVLLETLYLETRDLAS